MLISHIDDVDEENSFVLTREIPVKRYLKKVDRIGALSLTRSEADVDDYSSLLREVVNTSQPALERLRQLDLSIWLVLFGATFSADHLRKINQYSLSKQARSYGISWTVELERQFSNEDGLQSIGVYKLAWEDFESACMFQNITSYSFIVLSHYDLNVSSDITFLKEISDVSRMETGRKIIVDWRVMAGMICNSGKMLVNSFGKFDDHWRTLSFLYPFNKKWSSEFKFIETQIRGL